jgi:hypothetical protein
MASPARWRSFTRCSPRQLQLLDRGNKTHQAAAAGGPQISPPPLQQEEVARQGRAPLLMMLKQRGWNTARSM